MQALRALTHTLYTELSTEAVGKLTALAQGFVASAIWSPALTSAAHKKRPLTFVRGLGFQPIKGLACGCYLFLEPQQIDKDIAGFGKEGVVLFVLFFEGASKRIVACFQERIILFK